MPRELPNLYCDLKDGFLGRARLQTQLISLRAIRLSTDAKTYFLRKEKKKNL